MKLLIVEDSVEMRRELRDLVSDLADDIQECSDGSSALAAYHQHRPDWVLMDIVMKGMDGLEASRQIKSVWPDAKIVIVTSYDDDELKEASTKAGACAYVLKENLFEVRSLLVRNCTDFLLCD
jgi:NarL family two-component system response regulator LiaR